MNYKDAYELMLYNSNSLTGIRRKNWKKGEYLMIVVYQWTPNRSSWSFNDFITVHKYKRNKPVKDKPKSVKDLLKIYIDDDMSATDWELIDLREHTDRGA